MGIQSWSAVDREDLFKPIAGHARNRMSAIVFLILGCSLFIQNTVALEAFVALKTTDGVDIKALKNVVGVSVVYRVKGLAFWSDKGQELNHEWNYVVMGKGLKDGAAQDAFMSQVSGMDFVELFAGYRLSTRTGVDARAFNQIIKKADPKHFVERPMTPQSPKPDCTITFDLKKGETSKLITIDRNGDMKILAKLHKELFSSIFPSLGWFYKYTGMVDSSQVWDSVSIIDVHDIPTFCEYLQSQWLKEAGPRYAGVSKGIAINMAVEV